MSDGKEVKVYYSNKFKKDFKAIEKKHPDFSDALDDMIEVLRNREKLGEGMRGRFRMFKMPESCRSFIIYEDKSLKMKSGSGVGSGHRTLHTVHNSSILLLTAFAKNQQSGLDIREQKSICRSLQTVKDGTCSDTFKKLDKPLIRAILKDDAD